ncbi:MAG: bifunctional nuclease domain-containing protein [Candidatus Binatia bacterium]
MLPGRLTSASLCIHRTPVAVVFVLSLVLESLALSSCRSRVKMQEPVEVEVRQVGFDHLSNSPVVILQDKNSTKTMPIWIGIAEAQAIALQLQGMLPPRPLTHDLVKTILEQVGVEVDRVLVSELKGSTYYARICLMNGKNPMEVDSRPSDAIALALRFHRPIFVERSLFESTPLTGEKEREAAVRNPEARMGEKLLDMTVQDLTDDLAVYFELPTSAGVLVTEVEKGRGGDRLQRGDVIVAVNGEEVQDIDELRRKVEKKRGEVLTLLVRRDGKEIQEPLSVPRDNTKQEKEDIE